ncbi:FixH family protein [Psychrosphaera sp. B3R10]|uniref:FixH family protein n=1 Tax=unclassified Psychrosphaera TaxID=2641570 RepID=UPI001C0A211E|nr:MULTISPECIES: FixH family protein [unclassified Psychrosphaera]MBU2882314.1 FixH family protein [Psychrosphaera sp. I2R16]MBU2988995.1 FixH family protein [Psychrosphaera sp. B3R10]
MNLKQDIWYKNPYVWLVITLPMTAVIGGIATVIITSMNQPDMVVDDYYKKGKAINLELKLYKQAEALGIEMSTVITDQKITLENPYNFPAVKIKLVHSTLKYRDLDFIATPNAKGQLTAPVEHDISGKWQVFIEPMDGSWKLRKEIALPNSNTILIK